MFYDPFHIKALLHTPNLHFTWVLYRTANPIVIYINTVT